MGISLPYWANDRMSYWRGAAYGWSTALGAAALGRNNFWYSELNGLTNSFNLSTYAPGRSAGGRGPAGNPGYLTVPSRITQSWIIANKYYYSNNSGSRYNFSRTIGVRGSGVSSSFVNTDLAADASYIPICGSNFHLSWNMYVDDKIWVGMFKCNTDNIWVGSYTSSWYHLYSAGGRQHTSGTVTCAPPADNEYHVPNMKTNNGEHSINLYVRSI